MNTREVLTEDTERKVIYGNKVFRLTRQITGSLVILKAAVWDEERGWLSIHYWKGLKK